MYIFKINLDKNAPRQKRVWNTGREWKGGSRMGQPPPPCRARWTPPRSGANSELVSATSSGASLQAAVYTQIIDIIGLKKP